MHQQITEESLDLMCLHIIRPVVIRLQWTNYNVDGVLLWRVRCRGALVVVVFSRIKQPSGFSQVVIMKK